MKFIFIAQTVLLIACTNDKASDSVIIKGNVKNIPSHKIYLKDAYDPTVIIDSAASEVEKEGIDLGENQAILLKKIEELTLYIIQQQKEIDELKTQLQELKK